MKKGQLEPTLESLQADHNGMVEALASGGVVTPEAVEANRQAMKRAKEILAARALTGSEEPYRVAPQIAAEERRERTLRTTPDGGYAQSLTTENGN